MSHIIVVLHAQQINVLVSLCISEPNRKDQKFLFLLDGDVVEVFNFFLSEEFY